MNKIKLFCLPYAGGSARIYALWKKYLNSSIELCPVELAGRGTKAGMPMYESLEEAVDDIYNYMCSEIDTSRYAIFGHSMGSLLAYETVRKIIRLNQQKPIHVFISGAPPPHVKTGGKVLHLLPDEEFKTEIYKLGGTPREIFEHQEMMDMLCRVLKADYKILETYTHKPEENKLDCNLTVLNGKSDNEVKINNAADWKMYTEGEFRTYEFEGGHFFINSCMEDVLKIVNDTLTNGNESVSEEQYEFLFE